MLTQLTGDNFPVWRERDVVKGYQFYKRNIAIILVSGHQSHKCMTH